MNQREAAPYIRFWSHVIIQAIKDIDEQGKKRYMRMKACQKSHDSIEYKILTQMTSEAVEWIESDAVHQGSFVWICDHCDLDRYKLREMSRSRDGRKRLLKSAEAIEKARKKEEEKEQEMAQKNQENEDV